MIKTKCFTTSRVAYLGAVWSRGAWVWVVALLLVLLLTVVVGSILWGMGGMLLTHGTLMLGAPILYTVQYRRARRSVYDTKISADFEDPRTIEFSSEGIAVRTEGGLESRTPWSGVIKVERREPSTLVYLQQDRPLIVPDGVFGSHQDELRFDEMLRDQRLVGYYVR